MARMAKTIDSFTQNQTRLVVIIDGLDACEQDKVLRCWTLYVLTILKLVTVAYVAAERNSFMNISSGI